MEIFQRQKRRNGLERKAQIMSLTLKIFSEKGYNATSITDILNSCGIARRTFYLHFKGKKDIFEKIVDSNFETFREYISAFDLSISIPAREIKKFFTNLSLYYIKQVETEPELRLFAKIFLRDMAGFDEGFMMKANNFYDIVINMLAEFVTKAQKEKKIISSVDPMLISITFFATIKEIIFRWLILEEDIDIEKAFFTIINLYIKGVFVGENDF